MPLQSRRLANVSLALKGIYIHMLNASGPDSHLPANGSLLRDGGPAVGGFFSSWQQHFAAARRLLNLSFVAGNNKR